ncbi:uncharacterized protein FFE2_00045 [Fusarium fujikuroi]|nr:uncharacterized protein FFE2_00045 [Fusarium fujikuroi]
MDFKWPP